MARNLLARSRVVAACAALSAAAAGCAAPSSSSVTVSGKSLTIYVSAPPKGIGGQTAQDVYAAEQLAFQQQKSQVSAFSLQLKPLNGKRVSDNARIAIQDTAAIAYLGEIIPGLSADSLGITNAQDLLQVSPTDTAAALTLPTPAVANSPTVYYEALKTYGRTFARVCPTTASEAKAQVAEMQALHVGKLYIVNDGSEYGKPMALEVRSAAAAAGITIVSGATAADAVFYAGTSQAAAGHALDAAAQTNPAIKLFVPSALDEASFANALSAAAQRALVISAPGLLAKQLTPAAQAFVSAFQAQYGHAPAPEAIFGFEAMSAVMAVLHEAGASANNRATVVRDFFAIKNRQSALGTYSININGDTSLAPFVFSHLRGGKLVAYKSLQEQG